jgi:Cu/Ag efflux pump CusA
MEHDVFGLSPHDLLAWMAPYVARWGYLLVAVTVMLGNIGAPVPEETILLVGGYCAAKGLLNLWGLIPTAILSATGGDSLGYWLGCWGGRRLLLQYGPTLRDLASVIEEARKKIAGRVVLPSGYFVEYGGQHGSQLRSQQTLLWLGLLALSGIFLLLVQAFGSVGAALLVLVNLPLALIGGVGAAFLTGRVLNVSSLVGFIALFGIAARNGIILLTHYRRLVREEGRTLHEALVHGSMERVNPIVMTASVAALGLLPLLFGNPAGKELQRPLAWVILGGLVTSTLLNLVVVPTLVRRFGLGNLSREEDSRAA